MTTTRVLFLGGLGRSGTTLIERVLGELPGVCALGEIVHLWQRDLRDDERCGCGQRFSGCDFWQRVGISAFGGWHRVDVHRILALRDLVERTRHIPRLAGSSRFAKEFITLVAEYAGYYAKIYAAAARVSGANVVIDSSKHSALAHCLRHCDEVDLRVLHVVRDARGVAYSWTKKVARPEADGDEMTRYAPARSALLWNAHNAAFGLLRRRGVAVRRLRYEDFLTDPLGSVRRVAAFAGLDPSVMDLSFLDSGAVRLTGGHSAAGNPMRFTTGQVELRRDDAWRDSLLPRQRALVGAVCAPLLKAYGYPLGSTAPIPPARRGTSEYTSTGAGR
ncbi:sulfotransferase domain-containing protein [Catellatospora sp. TT07R-123]|uniref:sulfotransferase domain-containing protein n=1 Tax=Catellatospora sp. TT07R-123 TaxID=2733863 RepID=UPI001BB39C29|nr:sulfotransferase domain-containing protein [Catellatospora sp. TT07R-123]